MRVGESKALQCGGPGAIDPANSGPKFLLAQRGLGGRLDLCAHGDGFFVSGAADGQILAQGGRAITVVTHWKPGGCLVALKNALAELPQGAEPIHHTDQGTQYCCHECLAGLDAQIRVSRKRNSSAACPITYRS